MRLENRDQRRKAQMDPATTRFSYHWLHVAGPGFLPGQSGAVPQKSRSPRRFHTAQPCGPVEDHGPCPPAYNPWLIFICPGSPSMLVHRIRTSQQTKRNRSGGAASLLLDVFTNRQQRLSRESADPQSSEHDVALARQTCDPSIVVVDTHPLLGRPVPRDCARLPVVSADRSQPLLCSLESALHGKKLPRDTQPSYCDDA